MRPVLGLLVLAALGIAVGWNGGFDAGPQWAFAAVAGAAGIAAAAIARERVLRLRPAPAIAVLLAIGALAALSAAWTIGAPSAALRAGALAAGYGCLALAVAVLARPPQEIAVVIAFTAALTALAGLVSVCFHSDVGVEHLSGRWQAEGPLGYAPALALLQVAALPVLFRAMARARVPVSALAAGCAALAAGVIVLALNRGSLAMTALVAGVAIVAPQRTLGGERADAVAGLGLLAFSGLAVHEALGGRETGYTQGDWTRFLYLLLVLVAAVAAWTLYRRWSRPGVARRMPRPWALTAVIAVLAASLAAGAFGVRALGARSGEHSSFTHGRLELYEDSWHTMLDRPLSGYGAGTFLSATLDRQAGRRRLTRFAHDLPLELGVELGVPGLALAAALYLAAAALLWRIRRSPTLWLLGTGVAAYLVSNLGDWTWHLAGVGAVFALALGGTAKATCEDSV